MTSLPATDAAYALFHEIAAWIDDVTAGVRDFDDFADSVAGRLIPVADAARDEARAMGERVARVEALIEESETLARRVWDDLEDYADIGFPKTKYNPEYAVVGIRSLRAALASPAPTGATK